MNSRERGAALLVVLLMVAGMSAVAVGLLDTLRRGQSLWGNAATQAQAQWYALGAEAYVRALASEGMAQENVRHAFLAGEQAVAFPLDAGLMQVRLADGGVCLNLNGVVEGAGDIYQRHEAGAAQLAKLMTTLDIPARQADELVDALVAWIDTGGASGTDRDDVRYLNRQPAYITGAQPLAGVSELRAIQGFTPQIVARLRPVVCALPAVGPGRLNLNALTPEQAPLLVAVAEGELSLRSAHDILAARPAQGWTDASAFWAQPALSGLQPSDTAREQISFEPDYLDLVVDVSFAGAQATLSQSMRRSGSALTTFARSWSIEP